MEREDGQSRGRLVLVVHGGGPFLLFGHLLRRLPQLSPRLGHRRLRPRSINQVLHHLICRYKERRWDLKLLIGSGGMPSSHSATVTALALAIGFQEGFSSSLFATASILACVVMYDAFGIRLHAGRQAEVLNQIVYELPDDHPLADTRPLRELLGHTPPQVVAGALLGFMTSCIAKLIIIIASHF